jgi:hypothetical protein
VELKDLRQQAAIAYLFKFVVSTAGRSWNTSTRTGADSSSDSLDSSHVWRLFVQDLHNLPITWVKCKTSADDKRPLILKPKGMPSFVSIFTVPAIVQLEHTGTLSTNPMTHPRGEVVLRSTHPSARPFSPKHLPRVDLWLSDRQLTVFRPWIDDPVLVDGFRENLSFMLAFEHCLPSVRNGDRRGLLL